VRCHRPGERRQRRDAGGVHLLRGADFVGQIAHQPMPESAIGFFEELLSRLRGRRVSFDEIGAPVLPSTVRLIEGGEKVFSSPYPPESCGALLAQEWHAYPQLVFLYEGVRNYRDHFGLEEFHENCEYFYLHIGATEKEHKVHSLSTAAQMCRTATDLEHLERGFTTYLNLLADNWAEIHAAVQAN